MDVFFVLSGYLIFRINSIGGDFTPNHYVAYMTKRLRRIGPALFFNIGVAIPFVYYFSAPHLHDGIRRSLIATLCSAANIFYFSNTDYFSSFNESFPFLHFWSISLEIQFYVLAPVILLISLKSKYPKITMLSMMIASFTLSSIYMFRNEAASFYLLPTRLWEFLAGGLVFLLNGNALRLLDSKKIHIQILRPISITFLILILVTNILDLMPFIANLFACVCASLFLFQVESKSSRDFISLQPLVFIGNISYSLYLSHFCVFFLFENFFFIDTPPVLSKCLAVFFAFLISLVSYYFVEKPFLRSRLLSPRVFLKWCVIVVCILFGTIQLVFSSQGEQIWLRFRTGAEQRENLTLISKFANLDLSKSRIVDRRCVGYDNELSAEWLVKFRDCTESGQKAIVIFGDSHAMNLHNVYVQAIPESIVFTIAEGGCRPHEEKVCFYSDLISFVKNNSRRISTLIYNQSGSHLMQSIHGSELTSQEYNHLSDFRINVAALSKVSLYLGRFAHGPKVVWLGPFLEPQLDLSRPENWKSGTHISFETKRKFELLDATILDYSKSYPWYVYIPSFDDFRFPADKIFQDGCLIWSDRDHLSVCGELVLAIQANDFIIDLAKSLN